MSGPAEPTPVELHLGDRLAALIDGELSDEPRERVLAHLVTCPDCKAEADAQRRVKSVCAGSAPPPLSDGLLARLQGLPGAGREGPVDYFGPGASGGLSIHYPLTPDAGHHSPLSGGGVLDSPRGFRTHRPSEMERTARGRRFAFAAAGAVSLAAVALGGVVSSGQSTAGSPTTAAPARVPAAGVERGERRGESGVTERAAGPYAQPTTHSSPLSALRERAGWATGSRVQEIYAPGLGPLAAGRASLPLLSPPLALAAAQRGVPVTAADAPSGRSGARPYAMPSANGSPAGPQPPGPLADRSGAPPASYP
ncbi:zf-HC2 domain-containing protein [Streptomyces sp. P38-E01]|uniref:Zf-HC2 domain-containing protein n=1 Tax=Streptomyces tardus TaxID=2780544 RepID=A0A949JGX0_9ACTN|nr:zf-HC2 domain-containing protein [Streptomyces tardus]MBU7599232.1 zf-HC2 domain-containing protein [Streptomyces tardus]